MDRKTNEELATTIDRAVAGDSASLEELILDAQDLVFNLSLRMLGSFADAQDATQEILLKVVTHLSSFRGESMFSTWVFRIAVNHLKSYRKHMFAEHPLSFDFYGYDIVNGRAQDAPDLTQGVDRSLLAEELKMSCTNVMLQCLDVESRCIFVLGTMFRVDSRTAGEVLGMTPEAYRQRLSRVRKRMAAFLSAYCGEYGCGKCKCANRVNYAIENHRIDPRRLDYVAANPGRIMVDVKAAMEEIDDLAQEFQFYKTYASPEGAAEFIKTFLNSAPLAAVKGAQRGGSGE